MSGLPDGVRVHDLALHDDERGRFAEVFRASWGDEPTPVQWNLVRSDADVLRGVHVHRRHADWLCVVSGTLTLGLHDVRPGSTTVTASAMIELSGDEWRMVYIPAGVAHGFYFPEPTVHLYGVSHYWDPADELACRWDDPRLGLSWPCDRPLLSPRDRSAGGFDELATMFREPAP